MFIFAIILLILSSFVGGFMTRHLGYITQNRLEVKWYHLVLFCSSSIVAALAGGLLVYGGQ